MRIARHVVLLTGIVLALVSLGCQGQRKASTPKEALGNLIKSISEGDKSLFQASTTGATPEQSSAVFDVSQELKAYGEKFKAKFGQKAFEECSPSLFGVALPKATDDFKLQEKGDLATAVLGGKPVTLRRVSSSWLVDLSFLGDGPAMKVLVRAAPDLIQFIRQIEDKMAKEANSPAETQMDLQMGSLFVLMPHALMEGIVTDMTKPPGGAAGGTGAGAPPGRTGPERPTDGMTAQQKVSYAQAHFSADLSLVKKHPWARVPAPNVQEAARRVFGIGAAGSMGGPAAAANDAVNFLGLSRAQVISLVGNPSAKSSTSGEEVWTYAYKGTQLSANLAFRGDKVVRSSGGAG